MKNKKLTLKKLSKIIPSIGLEVECGCNYCLTEQVGLKMLNVDVGFDGSVDVDEKLYNDFEVKFHRDTAKIKELFRIIKMLYQEYHIAQNETCGNHIHLKISEKYLFLFSYQEFFDYFFDKYKKFFKTTKYLNRLKNKYCEKNENEETIINQLYKVDTTSRYKAINYKCLKDNGTIEIRIMPHCENHKEHFKQIKFVLRTLYNFIIETKNKEIKNYEIKIEKHFLEDNLFFEKQKLSNNLTLEREVLCVI